MAQTVEYAPNECERSFRFEVANPFRHQWSQALASRKEFAEMVQYRRVLYGKVWS